MSDFNSKENTIMARSSWVACYGEVGSVTKAALLCGIPRSTMYRWIKRFEKEGVAAFSGHSRRPIKTPGQKITPSLVRLIMDIRKSDDCGPQQISAYLLKTHGISLSATTVWRVLKNNFDHY